VVVVVVVDEEDDDTDCFGIGCFGDVGGDVSVGVFDFEGIVVDVVVVVVVVGFS